MLPIVNVNLPLDRLILSLTQEEQLQLRDQLNDLLGKRVTTETKKEIVEATNKFLVNVTESRKASCEICEESFIKILPSQVLCGKPECKKEKVRRYNLAYYHRKHSKTGADISPQPKVKKTSHQARVRVDKPILNKICGHTLCQKPFQTTKKCKKYCSKQCSHDANIINIKRIQDEKRKGVAAADKVIQGISEASERRGIEVQADILIQGKKVGELKELRVPGVADNVPIGKGHAKDKHPRKRKTKKVFVKERVNLKSDLNMSLIDEVKIKNLGEQRYCLKCGREFTSETSLYCGQDCKNGMKATIEMAEKNLNSPRKVDVLYNGHKV